MKRRVALGSLAIGTAFALVAFATDPPASKVNPQSGHTEIVDLVWDGDHHEVRHTIDDGSGRPATFLVTDSTANNSQPRLATSALGDTWVVWSRDLSLDQVLARKHTLAGNTWSSERLLSDPAEDSRFPVVVHDGTRAWVAFEFTSGADAAIAVQVIVDEPDPLSPRLVVATTDHAGERDVQIHAESNHLWVTWIDSSSEVGSSRFDQLSQTWTSPLYEPYSADEMPAARDRIREAVLGN